MHRTMETTPKTISTPPRIVTRLAVGAVAATAAIIGGQLAISPSAYASTTQDTVMVKTQRMTSDTLKSKQLDWYPKGKHLTDLLRAWRIRQRLGIIRYSRWLGQHLV